MTMIHRLPLLGAAACFGLAAPGIAQEKDQPSRPPPSPQQVPNSQAPKPDQPLSGSSQEPLSDTLSRSGGVLRPPDVDPGMKRAPPPTGPQSMPVIPPPGSPGGNPTIKPK
jgi:hypothetical protein